MMGEEKGSMEPQKAAEEKGCDKVADISIMEMIIGMVTGKVNDCASLSSVIAAPIAANCDA